MTHLVTYRGFSGKRRADFFIHQIEKIHTHRTMKVRKTSAPIGTRCLVWESTNRPTDDQEGS